MPDHGETSYRGLGRLAGKSALITGADSGIGRAVAIAFAREGADVLVSHLPQEERDGADTARWVEEAGRRAPRAPGDLCDEAYCASLVERAFSEFGRLDILVNNAAFQRTHDSIADITTAEFDTTFRTNVYAMFWLCRAALPRMQAGGAIINTASIQAYDPSPQLLAYAATKGAIVNFTKGLSSLAMRQGVRVNAVAPGPVWTPLIPSTMDQEKVRQFGGQTAFGRPAQPVELGTALRLPRVERSSLRHRRGLRSDRRPDAGVSRGGRASWLPPCWHDRQGAVRPHAGGAVSVCRRPRPWFSAT